MELLVRNKSFQYSIIVLFGVLIGLMVSVDPVITSLLIVGALFVVIVLPIPMRHTLYFMAAIVFIDISPVVLAGSYIRVHQLLFLVYFLQFVFFIIKTKKLNLNVPLKWSLFYWFITYFLAYNHALSTEDFWVIIVGQSYLYLFYLVIYNHVSNINRDQFNKLIKVFLNSGVFIALLGLLQWPLLYLGVLTNHYDNLGVPRPSSLLREPDWYGLMCAYISIHLLTFIIFKDGLIKNKKKKFLICLLGVVLSLSRASWLTFAVGAFILLIVSKKISKVRLIKFGTAITTFVVFVGCVIFLVFPSLFEVIYNRVHPETSTTTDMGAADSRMASIEIMKDFIAFHPWVGNGVGGMNWISQNKGITTQYIDGGNINSGRGNANIILTSLFDSGIIGTFFLVSFLVIYCFVMYRAYKKTKDYILLGFFVSFLALLTDFMFNNGIRFAFVWFHLGISLGYIVILRKVKNNVK
ncbi:hypothetical protein HMPREF3291_05330 [Bacillus sp. HMSC76G11]|nr:hypothetical protein HMPREF3291_05330 [Bacillus sp. HMSC76G11]